MLKHAPRRSRLAHPRQLLWLALLCPLIACQSPSETNQPNPPSESESTGLAAGSIERLDASFDDLVSADAVIEKLADGFSFIEGPVWVAGESALYFSDIPANTIFRWTREGGASEFLNPVMPPEAETGGRGGSNGLALDPQGRLVLCEHGNRQVSRIEEDGTRTVVADSYDGKRLNSPNDIVFHVNGSGYFTDPPYGLPGQDDDPNKEQDWNGIYRLLPDGSVALLNTSHSRPNGIGLSPDGSVLYVANSDAENKMWKAYSVHDDGSLDDGRVFFDANHLEDPGVPDGLAVDVQGNVWATGPGGVVVLSPKGVHLGTVKPDEQPANAGFGEDGKSLFMTARTGLYRVRVKVAGL